MYSKISACRLCGGGSLAAIIDLGTQALTGVFPRRADDDAPVGPLNLVKCATCDLVQLAHNYDLSKLYGENYGYRSGLNPSMVRHLQSKVKRIQATLTLSAGDLIVDIGSNDSTLLQAYASSGIDLVGIDPSGPKFRKYYPPHVRLIPEFFSAKLLRTAFPGRKAKVVTSIAMFYDLEQPKSFVAEIAEILHPEGVWVFEQSYLPAMLEANAYDTICHEHLEYYALRQIDLMLGETGLKIVDVEFNDANGGSFSVAAAHRESPLAGAEERVRQVLEKERREGIYEISTYQKFAARVTAHRDKLRSLLIRLRSENRKVFGYGASTKGNVIIQYCGLSSKEIPCIAEVNEDKFDCCTPGSRIPIIPEAEARALQPDYFVVFPWHFRTFIVEKERGFLKAGGKLIFPLPEVEIVSAGGIERIT